MDVITKDVANAGTNLPAFAQVFTDADPGGGAPLDGAGPVGSIGDAALSLNSDILEILAAEDRCPAQTLCNPFVAGDADTLGSKEPNSACLAAGASGFAVVTDNNVMTIQPIINAAAPEACAVGGTTENGGVELGPAVAIGLSPIAPPIPPIAVGNSTYAFLFPARIARYMIGFDPSDPDRVPLLWRSVTGRYTADGAAVAAPPPDTFTGAAPGINWQVVARGIEDLQVEYQDGLGNWTNSPPVAIPCGPPGIVGGCANQAAFDAIVRQVRVTLSARVVAQGLQGSTSTAGAGAPDRIRGQLVNIIQPRAAMTALEMGNQIR
jgi:hypothetical protein